MIAVEYHDDLKEVQGDAVLAALLRAPAAATPFDRLEWWQGLVNECDMLPLIAVADDGCGIPAGEVVLAFGRHTTSKLHDSEDLFRIRTLGFRGEALYAIAAVSQVTMTTKTAADDAATVVRVENGRIVQRSRRGAPDGRDLPALRHEVGDHRAADPPGDAGDERLHARCTAPTRSPGVVRKGWPPSVQSSSYSSSWRSSTACTRCLRLSALDSVQKRKLKSTTTWPGITPRPDRWGAEPS